MVCPSEIVGIVACFVIAIAHRWFGWCFDGGFVLVGIDILLDLELIALFGGGCYTSCNIARFLSLGLFCPSDFAVPKIFMPSDVRHGTT